MSLHRSSGRAARRTPTPLPAGPGTPSEASETPRAARPARAVQVAVATVAAAALAAGMLTIAESPAAADTADVTTTTAAGLVDSIGVNTHTAYGQTAYGNTARVVSLLQGMGVRHVRDGLTGVKQQTTALTMLGQAGIKMNAIVGATNMSDPNPPASELSEAEQLAPYLDSIEPTNEADCTGDPNWVSDLHAYSADLAGVVRSDPALSSVPLLGPAFCTPGAVSQYGSAATDSDIADAHDYARGQDPELPFESRALAQGAVQDPGKPMDITEFGYHDAGVALGNQPKVTAATAADYDVRAFLDAKRLGINRAYVYELMDEMAPTDTSEEHYGLVNSDGTVKPAYTAVKNLLWDVSGGDPASNAGDPATAQVPAVSVTGGGSLLRTLQIADTDGGGETVALWLDTPLDNLATNTRLPDTTTTVHLSVPSGASATVQQPSRGNALSSLGTGTAFDVPVDGAVTLVHLGGSGAANSGAAASSAPTCTPQLDYADQAAAYGATVSTDLAPGSAWTGSPGAVASIPGGGTAGAVIDAAGETQHVAVPGTSTQWTIALWERTDPTSASTSDFLHVTKAHGAKMRTYNLTDDVPSHKQISAIGLPLGSASFGTGVSASDITGTWHLLSLTEDGSNASFAVDGITEGTVPSTGAPLTNGIDVGALSPGFRGAIGGLEVFPSALSPQQLLNLATGVTQTCGASGGTTSPSSSAPSGSTSAPASSDPSAADPAPTSSSAPASPAPGSSSAPQFSSHISSYVPAQDYKGHSATLIARLMTPKGPQAGATMTLYGRALGASTWTPVATQTTGSDGTIHYAVSPSATTDYQWSFGGSDTFAASTSDTGRMSVLVYNGKASR